MKLTDEAFEHLRITLGMPRLPPHTSIANDDELTQMTVADGLLCWVDGPGASSKPEQPPLLEAHQTQHAHLWVVRDVDVVHAEERCAFGASLETRVIKHTNLTGGKAAFSGGELLFLDESTVVINGCSGRYGPRSKTELDMVAQAFAKSGYSVWSMGFDEETNRPTQFIGTFPEWVA